MVTVRRLERKLFAQEGESAYSELIETKHTNKENIMYTFKNIKTGKTYSYKTRAAASRAKDKMDMAYGAICTTMPRFEEVL